jgi:hypothetical protein
VSTTQRVLLLILGMADLAFAVQMFAMARESLRTGQQFREIGRAVPTVLVGALLAIGLVVLVVSTF